MGSGLISRPPKITTDLIGDLRLMLSWCLFESGLKQYFKFYKIFINIIFKKKVSGNESINLRFDNNLKLREIK